MRAKEPAETRWAYRIRGALIALRAEDSRARAGHGLLKGWGERGWD